MTPDIPRNLRRVKTVLKREVSYYSLKPREVNIEVTHRCNLKCKMCGVWKKAPEHRSEELRPDEFLNVFSQLRSIGVRLITLAGGEPFIRRDLFDIISAAKSQHLTCNIFTNGTLIDSSSIEKILEYAVDKIIVSLDGMPAVHDTIRRSENSFNKASQFLSELIKKKKEKRSTKPELDVHMTIMRDNVQDIGKVNEFCQRIGVNFSFQLCSIALSPYQEDPLMCVDAITSSRYLSQDKALLLCDEDINILRSAMNNLPSNFYTKLINSFNDNDLKTGRMPLKRCYVTRNFMMIDPYGNVFPCTSLDGSIMGNIRNESVINIWQGKSYRNLRKTLDKNLLPVCHNCCHLADNLSVGQLVKIALRKSQ